MTSIYLDGHSTTPLAPEAFEAMSPWWHIQAANSHSPHLRGMIASQAVETARDEVANLVSVAPQEITFTSGATEANNIAIRGLALAALERGLTRRRIVVSAIEHKSVLSSANSLRKLGFDVVEAPVTTQGVVDLDQLSTLINEDTLMVSVMAVNNEIGSIQPLAQITDLARAFDALIHVDAAQAAGKVSIDLSEFDLASLSSHKMYGPMGIGALFVSAASALRPLPLQLGGGQEGGIRPGTIPTPLTVGFGMAAKVAQSRLSADHHHSFELSILLLKELQNRQTAFIENVPVSMRVPGSISLRFPGIEATSLIGKIGDKLAISEGSACNSGQISESHVLSAMGLSPEQASETVRIFCSRYNTHEEIVQAAQLLASAVRDYR